MTLPLTAQQLDEIEAVVNAASKIGADIDPGTAHALLATVRRLQQQRKYLIDQLAQRDAETGRGDAALREFLAAHPGETVETSAAAEEACGKCRTPFDPADTRFDGHARYYLTPYCKRCVDACHDNEIADHRCVICA